MMTHTKEPWTYYDDSNDGKTNRIEIVAIGKTIARIYNSDKSQDLPNARRIAACVNACEGFETDVLESFVKEGDTVLSRLLGWQVDCMKATEQRDALLTTLKRAVANIEWESHPFIGWHAEAKQIIEEIESTS